MSKPGGHEGWNDFDRGPFDAESLAGDARRGHQLAHVVHEHDEMRAIFVAAVERMDPAGSADLVDGVVRLGEVCAAPILEQDDRAVDGHEHISARVACRVDLHVADAARVADVDGVEEHRGAYVVRGESAAETGQAFACRLMVDGIGEKVVGDDRLVGGVEAHDVIRRVRRWTWRGPRRRCGPGLLARNRGAWS